jgi:hypothetical protein
MTMANSSANSSTETTNAVQGAKVPATPKLVLFFAILGTLFHALRWPEESRRTVRIPEAPLSK